MRAVLLVATGLLLPAFASPEPRDYFPAPASVERARDPFLENWLGRQLQALGEPTLSRPADRADFIRRLRLLVVPYRDPSYAVRIDETSASAQLTLVVLDRPSQSGPDRVAQRRVRPLTTRQLALVGVALRRADLSRQPAHIAERPPRILPNGAQEIETCVHSTSFLFEVIDETGNYFVERNPCSLGPELARLANTLISFRSGRDAARERAILAELMRRR